MYRAMHRWLSVIFLLVSATPHARAQEVAQDLDVILTEALFGYYLKSPEYLENTEEPFQLNALKGGELVDPSGEDSNCPINTFELAGEGLRIKGGSGNSTPTVDPPRIYDDYKNLPGRFGLGGDLSQTTFVVIDDFGGGYAHGVQVLNHLLVLLEDVPQADIADYLEQVAVGLDEADASVQTSSGAFVRAFDHGNQPDALPQIISEVRGINAEGQIVVNMSFSLIPCSTKVDATENGEVFETFLEYQEALLEDPDNKSALGELRQSFAAISDPPDVEQLGNLLDRITASVEGSPALRERLNGAGVSPENLGDYLDGLVQEDIRDEDAQRSRALLVRYLLTPFRPSSDDNLTVLYDQGVRDSGGSRIVYVAAAGNYGRTFPLYPAAYPNVIAASSYNCDPDCYSATGPISTFSNCGQVAGPGASFEPPGQPQELVKTVIEGTSFAAPAASVYQAAQLAEAGGGGMTLIEGILTTSKHQNAHLAHLNPAVASIPAGECEVR